MVDHLKGLIEILAADGTLSALVSDRVFGGDLPRSETGSMPERSLVVKYSGSPGGPGSADNLELVEFRVDVLCYGPTFFEADRVRRAVYPIFKTLSRAVQSSMLFHRALHSGGPIQAREQETDWPFFMDSWDILSAQEAVS